MLEMGGFMDWGGCFGFVVGGREFQARVVS